MPHPVRGLGPDLRAFVARVELGEPMMTMNSTLIALARLRRRPVAVAVEGSFVTTPVAYECPAHDGFLDTEVTLRWPAEGDGAGRPAPTAALRCEDL